METKKAHAFRHNSLLGKILFPFLVLASGVDLASFLSIYCHEHDCYDNRTSTQEQYELSVYAVFDAHCSCNGTIVSNFTYLGNNRRCLASISCYFRMEVNTFF